MHESVGGAKQTSRGGVSTSAPRAGTEPGTLKAPALPYSGKIVQKSPGLDFREIARNSLDISKGICKLGMSEFESCQVSQPFRGSEKMPPIVAERPANSGL